MKILHTSDWHIGRKLYERSFDETHTYFFNWLTETINQNKVNVLVVAGDIFNNPFPSSSSLSIYYKALYNLSKTCLKHIIITGGNHDSISTLNAPKELLNVLNISVIGGYSGNLDEMIIEITDKKNKPQLVVCAVPFLKERDVRTSVSGSDFKDRISQISFGIQEFYAKIAEKVQIYSQKNIPIIATAHLFINDIKEMPDDEKKYFVGGLQQISFKNLPQIFDYFALGHIHKPYKIGGNENIRYCGAPVHLNFSERKNKSQVILIDFNDRNETKIEKIFIPIFRQLVRFDGTFSEVAEQISQFSATSELKPWAEINITEKTIDPLIDKKIAKLRDEAENIDIIKYQYKFTEVENELEKKFEQNVNLKDLKPEQIFDALLENVDENEKIEMQSTFNELVNDKLYEEN